mgnify:CR=1 FL=1
MPSLKDLAKECGVSVATVSKALNDQPDISPATRERVRAAAHRMGYLPNAAARSLKTNRTYNLGVLFVDERQSGLTHEYFSAVLDSFKVEAEKHGYDITFINHNISGKSMSYLEHCRYRNVDGVVIACVNFYEPQVVELVNSEVPVVTIDHVFNNRMAILSDNVFGLKALVRQAWACGHRRIAFIHGEKTAVTENRVAGSIKPAKSWAEDPGSLCAGASTMMLTAVPPRPKRCWSFRSRPPASSSRTISPRWAATTPSAKRAFRSRRMFR